MKTTTHKPTPNRTAWMCCLLLLAVLPSIFANTQSAAAAKANQAADDKPLLTFTARSELVLVPVIITNHKGEHIAGLKKEDFSLLEHGASRSISVFEEVSANNERVVAQKRDELVFSNNRGVTSAKRLVILALDTINTPINDQIQARKQILKFLSQGLDPDMLISVVVLTPGGVKVVHDFTTDTSVLIRAVSKLHGKSAVSQDSPEPIPADDSAVQDEVAGLTSLTDTVGQSAIAGQKQLAIRWTYDALTQIAQAYAGVPGRKSLVWVTAGFPFSFADLNAQISAVGGNGDVGDNLDAYQQMWQALTRSNFAVYPVDARGFVNSAALPASVGAKTIGSGKLAVQNATIKQMTAHDASLDTFRDLAEMTGGKAFFNTNDLSKSFREASEDSATYYVLGFYLDKTALPGWHDLKVKVDRAGAKVRARSGYLVTTKSETSDTKSEIRNAVISPFDSTGLPLEVRWESQTRAPGDSKTTALFHVMLSPSSVTVDQNDNNHLNFNVIAVAKQPDGTIASTAQKSFDAHLKPANAARFEKTGMFYEGKLELAAGKYVVRFVVQDRVSGRIGTVTAPLTIE